MQTISLLLTYFKTIFRIIDSLHIGDGVADDVAHGVDGVDIVADDVAQGVDCVYDCVGVTNVYDVADGVAVVYGFAVVDSCCCC